MMKSEGFMKTNTIRIFLLWAFLVLVYRNNIIALESDTNQRVIWTSDGGSTMDIVGDSRILEMNTNVVVTQGTLEIRGAKAIFEYQTSSNELTKITVHGTPVHYKQQLNEDGAVVNGQSNTLLFYTNDINETVLELLENASLESPESAISCNSIIYIVERNLIKEAVGPCAGALTSTSN